MAARIPCSRKPPFLPPGFRAAVFPRVLLTVAFDGLSEKGTARSVQVTVLKYVISLSHSFLLHGQLSSMDNVKRFLLVILVDRSYLSS